MGLPWFAFNIKDFIANTTRLNTEATGAYLLLMLDYYEQEEPPPDDNEVLSTIAGLDLDTWLKHRRVLEPLFDTSSGRWRHERIEQEIAKGASRHAASMRGLAAAQAANKAASGAPGKKAPASKKKVEKTIRQAPEPSKEPEIPSPAPVEAATPAPSQATQEHKHSIEGVSNDTPTRASASGGPETLVPLDFTLTGSEVIEATSEGYTTTEVAAVVDSFIRYHDAAGTLSDDWRAAWRRWWSRKKPALPAKAKPRVVVSTKAKPVGVPIPEDWQPNEAHRRKCEERGININDLAETFINYCHQPAGRLKYSDHDRAFGTFILNQPTFNRGSANAKVTVRGSIVDAGNDALAELDRRIAASQEDHGTGDVAVQSLPAD
jgi:uncharacterized protein YdaU (DUF1376 family)